MIAVKINEQAYHLYYRHSDGYPTGLGVELIDGLKQKMTLAELLAKVGAKDEGKTVKRPQDAFLEVQGDLEWIYVLQQDMDRDPGYRALTIYKTSHPHFFREKAAGEADLDFAFYAWFSYVHYLPEDHVAEMERVEMMSNISLHCLAAFISTVIKPGEDVGRTDASPPTDPRLRALFDSM